MPIYEYRCSACGHELEALQKLTDSRLVNCPSCHADALTKLVSAAGFQLKGKFTFGGKSDTVSLSGTIELPAGLDLSKQQEVSLGVGNHVLTQNDVRASGTFVLFILPD